ncbi:Uncharacterised protein [Vibrio cholerae]|nr:Uncharacterised protein [Vibrio cholerae]
MLETSIAASCSTMPPWTPIAGTGFWCFLTRLIPSTITLPVARTLVTLPFLPLSFPARTITSSF